MHFLTLLPGQRFFSVQDWQKMQFSWYDFDICSAKKKVEIWKIAIFYFSAKIVILNTMSKSTVLIIHIIKSFLFKEQNEGRKKGKAYSWLYFYDFEQQNLHFYCYCTSFLFSPSQFYFILSQQTQVKRCENWVKLKWSFLAQ